MNRYTIVVAFDGTFAQTTKQAENKGEAIKKVIEGLWEGESDRIVSITVTETIKLEENKNVSR